MHSNLREKWTLFTYGAVIARWQCLFCCRLLSMAKKQCVIWFDLIVRCQLFARGWIFKTSLHDTRRRSCFVYVLNTYFYIKHSVGLRWAIYLTHYLRGDSIECVTSEQLPCRSVGRLFLSEHRSLWRMFSACVARAHTRAHAYMHSAASARKKWSASAEAAASELHGYPHSDCFYIPPPHLCAFHIGMQLLNCLEYIRLLHSQ